MSEEEEGEDEDWWRRVTMAMVEEAAGLRALALVEEAMTPEADLLQTLLRVASILGCLVVFLIRVVRGVKVIRG